MKQLLDLNSRHAFRESRYKGNQIEEMGRYREVQQVVTFNILSESYIANIYILANYGIGISGNGTLSSRLIYEDCNRRNL